MRLPVHNHLRFVPIAVSAHRSTETSVVPCAQTHIALSETLAPIRQDAGRTDLVSLREVSATIPLDHTNRHEVPPVSGGLIYWHGLTRALLHGVHSC